jgi:hypothetical protein
MSRLRSKTKTPEPRHVEWAIATESFRPAAIGVLVSRGERRRISDPVVQRCPEYFAGIVELTDELLAAGRR